MDSLNHRKSIRKYSCREVSTQLLTSLLKDAERTPTMGNLQLYSVVVTRSKEMKEKLAPAHFNQPMVTGAPVVLTFCADFRRTTLWAENRKAEPGYDNFLSFINAATDTLLYCQTFCNLAEEEGLGTCFLGTTVYLPQLIIDTLKLPKLTFPVATITLGWPDEDPAQSDRLPVEAIIHEETYDDYTPERINQFYAYKESLAENKHFVEINHKETLAQVFTDLRYTRKDNEAMSEGLMKALKSQGFIK
ncbi:MAG TPA: NADPH-dependent oxidoreductase [Prevotella sp.]|nr:NADPH-dependent oxidoreductase [Prevotella sp.]